MNQNHESRVASLTIVFAVLMVLTGCAGSAQMHAETASLQTQQQQDRDERIAELEARLEASAARTGQSRYAQGGEDYQLLPGPGEDLELPPFPEDRTAPHQGQPGPNGAPLLGAVAAPPMYDPNACGQEGPFVGYTTGAPYHIPGQRDMGESCQGSCLFAKNRTNRHVVLYVTNGNFERTAVTICAGRALSAVSAITRPDLRGTRFASVLMPGQSVSIGKINGLATIEISKCVALPGRAMRCSQPQYLYRGTFPMGENGRLQFIDFRADEVY